MSKKRDGGPAFPIGGRVGMTLRDYFAAQALQALVKAAVELDGTYWAGTVKQAYLIADDLIRERDEA